MKTVFPCMEIPMLTIRWWDDIFILSHPPRFHILGSEQNGRHLAEGFFKCIFLNDYLNQYWDSSPSYCSDWQELSLDTGNGLAPNSEMSYKRHKATISYFPAYIYQNHKDSQTLHRPRPRWWILRRLTCRNVVTALLLKEYLIFAVVQRYTGCPLKYSYDFMYIYILLCVHHLFINRSSICSLDPVKCCAVIFNL